MRAVTPSELGAEVAPIDVLETDSSPCSQTMYNEATPRCRSVHSRKCAREFYCDDEGHTYLIPRPTPLVMKAALRNVTTGAIMRMQVRGSSDSSRFAKPSSAQLCTAHSLHFCSRSKVIWTSACAPLLNLYQFKTSKPTEPRSLGAACARSALLRRGNRCTSAAWIQVLDAGSVCAHPPWG